MSVTRRVAWLEQGEEIRGVEAVTIVIGSGVGFNDDVADETHLRRAMIVDPPFVAERAGWHLCTMDTETGGVLIVPCDEPPADVPVGSLHGSEATRVPTIPPAMTPEQLEEHRRRDEGDA